MEENTVLEGTFHCRVSTTNYLSLFIPVRLRDPEVRTTAPAQRSIQWTWIAGGVRRYLRSESIEGLGLVIWNPYTSYVLLFLI